MPLSCEVRVGKGVREKERQAYSHYHALNVKYVPIGFCV